MRQALHAAISATGEPYGVDAFGAKCPDEIARAYVRGAGREAMFVSNVRSARNTITPAFHEGYARLDTIEVWDTGGSHDGYVCVLFQHGDTSEHWRSTNTGFAESTELMWMRPV